MLRTRHLYITRIIVCLVAICLSLGSVASASMMGMMMLAPDGHSIAPDHVAMGHKIMEQVDSHQVQISGAMSHSQMMQSGDNIGSYDVSCDQLCLCVVSNSLPPEPGPLADEFHRNRSWPAPSALDYQSNLHTQLYKPPRI